MRIIYCLFIVCFFSIKGFSQIESPSRTIKISPIKKPDAPPKPVSEATTPAEIKYESSINKTNDDKLLKGITLLPKKEEKGIMEKEPIRNPSEMFTDKMNKKSKGDGEIFEKYKSDTFLGEFKSGTKIIKIACRDHEYPDGDLVRIWLNDAVAVDAVLLEADFKEVYLDLNEGINKIEIEALNQGESGPNTAQFTILDAKGKVIANNKWNLTTGVKAKIVITKQDLLER
jgi:hypothetical protein